jgi:hypothetical protein
MTNADHAVITARAALQSAEEQQHEERQKELLRELEKVRAEKQVATARHNELAAAIKQSREQVGQLRSELKRAIEHVNEGIDRRPRVADYLPNDPEVLAWRRQQEALEQTRDRISARLREAGEPERHIVELVRYNDPVMGILPQLERAEQNLMRQLDPEEHKRFLAGGVYHVG